MEMLEWPVLLMGKKVGQTFDLQCFPAIGTSLVFIQRIVFSYYFVQIC